MGYVFRSSITGKNHPFLEKMPSQDVTMTPTHWERQYLSVVLLAGGSAGPGHHRP